MVSLISIILNWIRGERTIKVRRLPPRKVLRAHQLGLSIGLLLALLIIVFSILFEDLCVLFHENPCMIFHDSGEIFNTQVDLTSLSWIIPALFVLIMALASSWAGGFLVIIVTLFAIFGTISGSIDTAWEFWLIMTKWYTVGYLFGAIFSILYNDLVFLHLIFIRRDLVKIAFAYDPAKKINILKSPIEKEEFALLQELKPILYYTCNIAKGVEVDTNADKIISFIKEAFNEMNKSDKQKLKELITGNPDIPDDDFSNNALSDLERKLKGLNGNGAQENAIDTVERGELLLERYLKLKENKLYNYRILNPPLYPYTIAFVANPHILKLNDTDLDLANFESNSANYDIDPIINNRDLFLRSVERAMASLEQDEIVGRPEIWSRIRIITFFDETLAEEDATKFGLLQPFRNNLGPIEKDIVAENTIDPRAQMHENYRRMLREKGNLEICTGLNVEDLITQTDVVFALSASPQYDRSFAHFSDYLENHKVDPNPGVAGESYEYDSDPGLTKSFLKVDKCKQSLPRRYTCVHDYFTQRPGRIALNVIGASTKTFIHEFGHAMSSAYHGAIVDEYFDRFNILDVRRMMLPTQDSYYYVNRIERELKNDGTIVPVHKIFARYNNTNFYSDFEHVSAEEDWIGYFPERKNPFTVCTMDRNYSHYHFDELLSNFIYDRLLVKINRDDQDDLPPLPLP